MTDTALLPSERAVYALRELYRTHGYRHYKVSKFEEYDLYAGNKSFLADRNVLTFTDTDGRLLALKPDITLSIIKNTKASGGIHKVFYNEHVYRTNGGGFREIMQTGLECLGEIDFYSACEVLCLAYKSLGILSENFLLELSDMGFVSGLIEMITDSEEIAERILNEMGAKNTFAIRELLKDCDSELVDTLCEITMLYGDTDTCLEKMEALVKNARMESSLNELKETVRVLKECACCDNLRIDFSITNDMHYYNGIIFKGYIDGIAKSVLSGGRYDSLLADMGKKGAAIGFAVYLDELDRLLASKSEYDLDTLVVYDSSTPTAVITDTVNRLISENRTVMTQCSETTDLRVKSIVDLRGGER